MQPSLDSYFKSIQKTVHKHNFNIPSHTVRFLVFSWKKLYASFVLQNFLAGSKISKDYMSYTKINLGHINNASATHLKRPYIFMNSILFYIYYCYVWNWNTFFHSQAYVVLGQYLVLKKSKYLFMKWLKDEFNAPSRCAIDCYNCLTEWCASYM